MDNTHRKHEPEYQTDHSSQYDSGLKSLVKSLQVSFIILVIIIVGMLVYFFTLGGYFIVKPQEAVIVLRFGKYVDTYTENWHWFFPYPVNSLVTLNTSPQIINVDFKATAQVIPGAPDEQQQEMMSGPLEPGKDRYLITADANIIHTSWMLEYQVSNPKKYYESCLCPVDPRNNDELLLSGAKVRGTRGPQTLLKEILRNVVIKITANRTVDEVLYDKKQDYKDAVQLAFAKNIEDLDIGIKVNSVTLQQAFPPLKTKSAFSDVTSANQAKSTMIDKANEYRVKLENSTVAERAGINAGAETYRKQVVSEVKAENIYFEKIYTEYKISPDTVLMALYNFTLSDVLGAVQEKYLVTKSADRQQQIRLKINPEPLDGNNRTSEATEGK